jgi:dihydrofolate synthase/folylpolyglutamate synthase
VNGTPLSAEVVDGLAGRIMDVARTMASPPSFFEATTAMALEGFREAAVNAAVLEVGLGGRLDATNAVPSRGVGITAVDYDHQEHLGHTLEEIAREKAGVIKPGGLVVLGENSATVCRVVLDMADAHGARLIYAPDKVVADAHLAEGRIHATITTPHAQYEGLRLGLRGWHQLSNAITAIRLLEELTVEGVFQIGVEAISIAVQDVVWPARLELIGKDDQAVLIDGAHNPAAARVLASYILEVFARPLPFVFGAMRDKNIRGNAAGAGAVARRRSSARRRIRRAPQHRQRSLPLRPFTRRTYRRWRRHTTRTPSRSRARSDLPSLSQDRCIWRARFRAKLT